MSALHPPSIDPRAFVSAQAVLAPGCTVAPGAFVPAGVLLEERVQIGPNAVFIEPAEAPGGVDTRPRTCARSGVHVGANAVIHAGVTLAAGVVVRPGAVVTRSVPAGAIVEGNPATIVGYVGTPRSPAAQRMAAMPAGQERVAATGVAGVRLHRMPVIPDLRGNLTVGEFVPAVPVGEFVPAVPVGEFVPAGPVGEFVPAGPVGDAVPGIPFIPKRYFMVFGVPSRETRGEHAHRACHQFLLCVRGSCSVVADDGSQRVEVLLDSLDVGLYLPPMTWGIQYRYSADAVLLVFASHAYDAADYIRDYDAFLAAKAKP